MYADDSVFYLSDVSLTNLYLKLNHLFPALSGWLAVNKLTPNVTKRKLMVFGGANTEALPVVLFQQPKIVEYVDNFEYL